MKVILKEDVERLGRKGDIVEVADGYGRNYLIPKGLALQVTKENIAFIEQQRRKLQKIREKEFKNAQEMAEKLSQQELLFRKKAGESEVLYGSVTSAEIAQKLEELGFKIDKKQIVMKEPIKRLGEYVVEIKVHPDVKAEVKIKVEPEEPLPSPEE